jgi:benzoate transport
MTLARKEYPADLEDPRAMIARAPMSRVQIVAVALATALNALDGFDILSISFAAPGIAADWHVDRAALGIVLSMELVGMGIGSLILGRVADRIGRRPVILVCLALMALGMVLSSTAASVGALSAYRLLTGLGIGGMLAATNAIVAEFANARRRNLAIVIMGSGYPLGAILGGMIVARILAMGGSWHSIFEVGSVLTALFLPLVWLLLPETIAFLLQTRRKDTLARVNRLLVRMKRQPVDRLPEPGAAAVRPRFTELFGPGFRQVTVFLAAGYFLQIMTFYFLLKWIPKLVVDFGHPASSAAGVLVWANVGGVIGSLLLSLLTQKVSVRALTAIWMLLGACAVILFGRGLGGLSGLSMAAAVADFFLNGANVGLYAMIAQSFPARLRAGATGLIIGIGRSGAALGPILAGLLLSAGLKIAMVALILSAGSLLAAASILLLRYREAELA